MPTPTSSLATPPATSRRHPLRGFATSPPTPHRLPPKAVNHQPSATSHQPSFSHVPSAFIMSHQPLQRTGSRKQAAPVPRFAARHASLPDTPCRHAPPHHALTPCVTPASNTPNPHRPPHRPLPRRLPRHATSPSSAISRQPSHQPSASRRPPHTPPVATLLASPHPTTSHSHPYSNAPPGIV